MSGPARYRPRPKAPALTEAQLRAVEEPTTSPGAVMDHIRNMYLPHCSAPHRAYLTAPAYGVLHADAHSSVHPDLIGPVVASRDEAIALCDAARTSRPDVQCVVMAGVTALRRETLAEQGFHIPEDDLMAPGTRVFIDRQGRTPKALLRAHRREGKPLEEPIPAPPVGVL